MPADSPELKLARLLAKPFVQRSTDDRPLSFRCLPEGGMVVISADGRKLWFTLDEVNQARTELGMKPIAATVKPPAPPEKEALSALHCLHFRLQQTQALQRELKKAKIVFSFFN